MSASKAEKVEKTEKAEKVEKTEKAEKAEKAEKVEKVEQTEKVEKVEKKEKVEKAGKIESKPKQQAFDADVSRVMDIVINSLYSKRKIFLRELISNSSDAIEHLKFASYEDKALLADGSDYHIRVSFDKDKKTVTIIDNGVGMSHEDVVSHLGTIAKSGTKAFLQSLSGDQSKDSKLIGQFGVGFYSSFIVADKVVVRSRRAGVEHSQGVQWQSDGKGTYLTQYIDYAPRGTEITLFLKEEHLDLLDDYQLKSIIREYSDYVIWPIEMLEMPIAETAAEGDDKDKAEKKEKKVAKPEWKQVNSGTPIWSLPKSENKEEDYKKYFQSLSGFGSPLKWTHNKVEGTNQYISLLYIPEQAPFDMWQREKREGLKLYVNNVFIMDDAEHLLPNYLRFVTGVVDSSDLPLNVSREILQSNKTIDKIRAGCVKRVLDMIESMAKDEDQKDYKTFWAQFGQVLKEGVIEDFAQRDRIAKLLRFNSTHDKRDMQNISLADYVTRMKEGQEKIYYVSAENYNAAANSPLLEVFKKKDIEVLLLTDRVDEWLVSHLTEFDGKKLQSVAQGALDLDGLADKEEAEKEMKQQEKTFEDTIKLMSEVLKERVKEVRITNRLVDSPACVVHDDNEMSSHMQRLMSAAGQAMPTTKPILEINPDHALVRRLKGQTDKALVGQWAEVLLSQALLSEGDQLKDPTAFIKTLNELLAKVPE